MNKLILTFFLALLFVPSSVAAQSAQDDARAPAWDKRQFVIAVSRNVPVEVKLLKEESFEDMSNVNWARDLEIKVKNTGSKPIYFIYVTLEMPEVFFFNTQYAIQLHYGRADLVRLTAPTKPDDIPIQPGGSTIFTIPKSSLEMYEMNREQEHLANPRTVRFVMNLINFGDGTGLAGIEGQPLPHPIRN
ncbi:MAG: hypothetical protein WCB68_22625 [Pyrinomonadaceae bacterium]